jgi:3-methyladenine DNA glycosylase Mpg
VKVPWREVKRTPRIGVDYAGAWALKPWRFVWSPADEQ